MRRVWVTTEERILILCPAWRGWPSLVAFLCLLSFISVAAGQNAPQGNAPTGADQSTTATEAAAASPEEEAATSPGEVPEGNFWLGSPDVPAGALPVLFRRRLVSRFSFGEGYDSGVYNANNINASDTYTDLTTALLYDLRRKHSEYTFDYAGSARHYNRFSGLDVATHQAGFGQVVEWTPRLSTVLGYRFSFTPDFPGNLLQESISQDLSLASPSAGAPPLTIPAQQGLVMVRSSSMTHVARVGLSYKPSLQTKFSVEGNFQRQRYQDPSLFGSESAGITARAERSLTSRTALGISYGGSWFHQPGVPGRSITHTGSLLLRRQLTEHVTVSASGGRSWSYSTGIQLIPLSPVLSGLLGVPALTGNLSQSFTSWSGNASLLAHWQRINFGFAYGRGIANSNMLGRPANSQSFTLSFGKLLGRSLSVTGSVAYQQSDFFTVQNLGRMDQGMASLNFTRKLGSVLDFSIFANYSRMLNGVQSSLVFNRLQAGIRFAFNLPRVRAL